VTLPQLTLDDRDFQSLVTEARVLIAKTCPEWTDHNVSDPGITLIELFAWMTDILLYRVNRIPTNVQIALLNLLEVQRVPAAAAHASVRFMLNAPAATDVKIPAHVTEVTTAADDAHEAVVFRVARAGAVPVLALEAMALTRDGEVVLVPAERGKAFPTGAARAVFGSPPAADDAFYLGTPTPLSGLVVRVSVSPAIALGAAIRPGDPPWIWEASTRPAGTWGAAEVLYDTSGGFNLGTSFVDLQLPRSCAPTLVAGLNMYWLRCRLPQPPGYLRSPEIDEISLAAVGAVVDAEHAAPVELETLGTSDGTPYQSFNVLRAPTLPLAEGEGLEVHDPGTSRWTMWQQVDSFADSNKSSPHYVYDAATGEVRLGPAIRVPRQAPPAAASTVDDFEVPTLEAWKQCGKVPPAGAILRMSRYHHGGGYEGNVPAGSLVVLRTPIPGVASVTNPRPASGGIGLEDVDHARQRAARELRTRYRAITAADYELLGSRSSNSVARVRCEQPEAGEAIPIRVLAKPPGSAIRFLSLDELTPSAALLEQTASYLAQRSPIGTSIDVTPVPLRGVTVVVEVEAEPAVVLSRVEEDVRAALYEYLNPVVGGDPTDDDDQQGWEWGRRLTVGELHPIVRAVPDVRSIIGLRAYETELLVGAPPTRPTPKPLDHRLELLPSELIVSGQHQVRAIQTRRRR
jgi:predicted phage baseplate assembly protein